MSGRVIALCIVAIGLSLAAAGAQDLSAQNDSSKLASLPNTATQQSTPQPGSADSNYRLGVGDKLQITVYGETDLSGNYDVEDGGYLRLPLIGQLNVAGLTIVQAEDRIRDKLAAGYIKNPRVSAAVVNYRPFYIIGEVNKPGEYPYASGMTVLEAVALAGGFTYRADDTSVYIRRKGVKKEESAPADQTTKVEPGDIVRVAESFF